MWQMWDCKNHGIHRLCIPGGEGCKGSLWVETLHSSLHHVLLSGLILLSLAELRVSLRKGVSDPRRVQLELGAAAYAIYKCTGDS